MSQTRPLPFALALFAAALAPVLAAWIIEALGYAPCELCLKERVPYYAAVPVAGLAIFFATRGLGVLVRAMFLGLAVIFTLSAFLGVYHAGIEWGFWQGPQECTGGLAKAVTVPDFLAQLQHATVPRCDLPALKIFGFSLAFWNALLSAGLAVFAMKAMGRSPQGGAALPRWQKGT